MPSDIARVVEAAKARLAAVEPAEAERLEAETQARIEAATAEEQARTKRRRRDAAEIPPRVAACLDAAKVTDALAAVQRFLGTDRTFLVLAGAVGCGKTIAACSALDAKGGKFVKAAAITRARFDDERWEALLRASVLVVDDLGTESMDAKGWAAGALAELFDYRYDWQSKTILTTNLDADAFKARYCEQDGGRFLSRLREAGVFEAIAQGSLRSAS